MDYPEHEKLKLIQSQSQAVGDFIEWLGTQGMAICRYEPSQGGYLPVRSNRDHLLAKHFEIDQTVLEAEKRTMIEELRGSIKHG